MMTNTINFTVGLLALLVSSTPILAYSELTSPDEWQILIGTTDAGLDYAKVWIDAPEYRLELSCDTRDDSQMFYKQVYFRLFVPSLPNLFAQGDMNAKLWLFFALPGGGIYEESISAHYYDGGPRDQAWLGIFPAQYSTLNVMAAADTIQLLNPDGEPVFTLPTKGAEDGVAAIREQCKIGLM
ncbi:hypothetical protein [Maritalea sp.]|jgi:hypothetical protein|uniref:hypothetical protein n=1 Tax=Maritalea sp. TaxID=2003361 RepID=UPI0039E449D7